MGKKLKGGRRQILQLEEKKPPPVPSKSKPKSLIHYSDSDDDSKKSNDSESLSTGAQNTPLESKVADFFKEIDALSVPDELFEEPDKLASSSKTEQTVSESCSSDTTVDLVVSATKDSKQTDTQNKEPYCAWQEIPDSSTGYSYYWNVQTNEVTWDCPPEYSAYVQALNASTEKTNQNDKNTDAKEKKKKKNEIIIPEGAIIPISYFGNSSSDDSSDSENESNKEPKFEKLSEPKTIKTSKKVESRTKTNEGETSEIIGPSLPPDFQFPGTESPADETGSRTDSHNEVHELVEVGPSLPPETLSDVGEKPSQSDLDELPAESSTPNILAEPSTHDENSPKDGEKMVTESNQKPREGSPDSTVKKGETSLLHNAYQVSNSTCGFRPVVEYDSFTDEEEEADVSSSKPIADENDDEVKSPIQQEQDDVPEISTSIKILPETKNEDFESKTSGFKRKAPEPFVESSKKEELIKKPKRSDVNIDSLFASHSSHGNYGFGFGWQKQLDEEEELCTTSTQEYKTRKRQNDFKAVSFVKSEDVLDLKALNDDIVDDKINSSSPDRSVPTISDCDPSNVLEQNDKPLPSNEELTENAAANEDIKISTDCDPGSSSQVDIKDKIDFSALSKKKKNKLLLNAASTSLKIEDDLDEIDKALSEALEAKKSAKNLPVKSSDPVSDATNSPKSTLESTSNIPKEKSKDAELCKENAIDTDAMADDILEISSELIDKLTFLLSAPSTHASFSGVFFQLQTRFVDWQAGALDSAYFTERLKELEQYIQHYETGVISGEWTYQWDRENKRYFFVNTRTQHSQWTYPEELCSQGKSSWVQSQADAGPSSISSFTAEQDDLQTVSSTMHENSAQKHSTPTFKLESKDDPPGARWARQSSPPPPPPGVDSPPHASTPPDSTETLREPEDMDLEVSNDSSSFLFVNNKSVADDGRAQFMAMVEQSSKRSVSSANPSIFSAVSSTSMSGCEDLSTVSKLSRSTHPAVESSDVCSQPSCSSQAIINSVSTANVLSSSGVPANLNGEKSSDVHAGSSNAVCPSQSKAFHLKTTKSSSIVSKKEKKKTKIQPGLGLKKKNIPSLVEKWQKIKEQQNREDSDSDNCKNANSFS